MALHLRILWGVIDPKGVPSDPPPSLLKVFLAQYSTETDLYAAQEGPELIPRGQKSCQDWFLCLSQHHRTNCISGPDC